MTHSHGLAGVDDLFEKSTQFCMTSLAHHAFNKRVRGGSWYPRRIPNKPAYTTVHSAWPIGHRTKWCRENSASSCGRQSNARRPADALLYVASRGIGPYCLTIYLFLDTLYVDLSRYNGSPIAKVRSHLKHWMEKACWHKPSLLVLDNIDKLMGTELEVTPYLPAISGLAHSQ